MKTIAPHLFLLSLFTSQKVHAALCGSLCSLHSLRFNDEFNGIAVNNATWNYRTDKGASPRLSYQRKENVGVGSGNLHITLKNETIEEYNYTGGGLVSKRSFHYGYFEANMSLNNGVGWHSSFWLTAGNGTFLPGEKRIRTEIDVFEVDSIQPTWARHNIIKWNGSGAEGTLTSGVNVTTFDFRDWHVWGFLWTEEGVNVWIDGQSVWTQLFGPKNWQHNLLNVWLTCVAYKDIPDNSALPGTVKTDYIRYYQKDYYLTAGSLCDWWSQPGPCPSNVGYSETGTWLDSSLEGYTKGLLTRYICASDGTASWTMTIPTSGTYVIWAYIVAFNNSDTHAAYDIYRDGTAIQQKLFVDQVTETGWKNVLQASMGVFITAGQQLRVTVTSSGSGCTRADSVKFVRAS